MLRLPKIRSSTKAVAWGAAGILGLLLVGATQFTGSDAQSRYQAIVDGAFDAQSAAKSLLIRLLELRHHRRDFALRRDDEHLDQ
jgi:hypothetical protein